MVIVSAHLTKHNAFPIYYFCNDLSLLEDHHSTKNMCSRQSLIFCGGLGFTLRPMRHMIGASQAQLAGKP